MRGICITCDSKDVKISGVVGSTHGVCEVCDRIVQKALGDGSWHKTKERVDNRNEEIEREVRDWFDKNF